MLMEQILVNSGKPANLPECVSSNSTQLATGQAKSAAFLGKTLLLEECRLVIHLRHEQARGRQ